MFDPAEGVALFTDGSAWYKDGSGGWAWVAIDGFDGELRGSGSDHDTTNNRMEMRAVVEGLTSLHDLLGAIDVLVYSDSEILIKGATGVYGRHSNQDLWKLIDEAVALHKLVEWNHVRGHRDSHYNCLVDELAGEARRYGQEVG